MFNIDPRKLAVIQESTKHIKGVITIDYKDYTVLLMLSSDDEEASKVVPSLLESFSQSLAQQLSTFFCISGKIVERNKGGED